MKVLLDSSVLVAALLQDHPAHDRAALRLNAILEGIDDGLVAGHSLMEVYSVLTRMPSRPRISPSLAHHLIKTNITDHFSVIALSPADFAVLIERLAAAGIQGGAVYDAMILFAAEKAGADQVITLNERDFSRVLPEMAGRVASA